MSYNFENDEKTHNCTIITAQEMAVDGITSSVIVVGMQFQNKHSLVVVITLQGSRVLGHINIDDKLSCLQPISKASYHKGRISKYDGCVAIGTVSGKIILVDTCLKHEVDMVFGQRLVMNSPYKSQCHVELDTEDHPQISSNHIIVRQRGIYFGLQLASIEEESYPITTLLDLPSLMAFAAGYADGRIVLYDLFDLSILHIVQPFHKESPIVTMNMIEPTDDPKACVYIWAFHASKDGAFAVMHTLMFEEKYVEHNGHVYEHFLSCSPRLNITCYDKDSYPLGIQSIMKTVSQEEEVLTLSVLSWIASDKSTNVLVFDLNQWYKAEMPITCDWRHELNHTVVFNIKEIATSIHLVTDSLIPFNSIQRPEEHFYPNSLSFDIITLHCDSCPRYYWIGLQNNLLDYLERNGTVCLMEPNRIYNIMLRSALIPQFIEYNYTFDAPLAIQREYLLSVALEYNCCTMLNKCALSWADGSHLGKHPEEGTSLSTLTDWMWNRAKVLKDLSNTMYIPLFDLSGRRIDCGTQKTLLHCSRQMSHLTKLYELILDQCSSYIPDKVLKCLESQKKSVQLATEYQEVVQWLLNVGLLPEGNIDGINLSDEFLLVPFPYQAIRSYYSSQRIMLNEYCPDKDDPTSIGERNCKFLFIDNFVEREFPGESLQKVWIENSASGVYPPNSMQNMLRALLIPNVDIEIKYILLCYTFMDLTAVFGDGRYGDIVQNLIKFPAVFKLSSAIIKRTQAFWFLDHGNINGAIEELLSPMAQTERFPHWQQEFLVTALLRHDAPHLALRAIRSPSTPISPFLELKTLLENNLIYEAFKLQRSKNDINLLCSFFEGTLKSAKYEVLLDLALSEKETRILREYLPKTNQPMAENVHFIHLLQKLDFVDAVRMVDKLGKKRSNGYNLEAPKEALALYHSALEPTTQHLSYLTFAAQKHFKPSKAVFAQPLSSRLIRGRVDFRDRIYHKCIAAIKEAAEPLDHAQPFLEKPGLGIFQYCTQTKSNNVCYPVNLEIKVTKRKHDEDNLPNTTEKLNSKMFLHFENPTKRRKIDMDIPHSEPHLFPKTVLTEFKPIKSNFNFSRRYSKESITEKSFSRSPSTQLSTPIVKKMFICNPPSPESVSSYTPHGILKSTASVNSFLNQKSVSLASVAGASSPLGNEAEEKILRFDIPEPTQIMNNTQDLVLKTPTQDESILSSDVFFSPEGSIVSMENEAHVLDIKDVMFSRSKSLQSIHNHSRSNTPEENNIAIIIEDVEDDSSSKQQEAKLISDIDNIVEKKEPLVTKTIVSNIDLSVPANNVPSGLSFPDRPAPESSKPTEVSLFDVLEDDVESTFLERAGNSDAIEKANDYFPCGKFEENRNFKSANSVFSKYIRAEAVSRETSIVIIDDEEQTTDTMELKLQTSSEVSSENNDNDKYMQEQVEVVFSTEKVSEDENIETSMHVDVINISSSSSSSNDNDDNDENQQDADNNSDDKDDCFDDTNPAKKPLEDECKNLDAEEMMNYADMGSAGPKIESNRNTSDFYSDTVPDIILDPETKQEIHTGGSNEAQVSTTTSANSNVDNPDEPANVVLQIENIHNISSEIIRHHEAEDLTVQQEVALQIENRAQTPEPSTSRARHMTVSLNERTDAGNAEGNIVTPSRDESFSLKKDDKFLGQPKKAHEVEIPVMNLSVKPDEAHEANRKNSKSDESDDAAVLNLSTGPIVGVMPSDEQKSETDNSTAIDNYKNVSTSKNTNREQSGIERNENQGAEASSTDISKDTSMLWNDTNHKTKTSRSRRISTDSVPASSSTPRRNIRTRRMSAIEEIEKYETTPSKRRTRASSIAAEIMSPNTPLGCDRKHSSMTNIATPENEILTPRRSLRATSLAKEFLTTTTPIAKKRCSSETKTETIAKENINSLKKTDSSSIDELGSEKSFTSSISRRRGRRYSAMIGKQTTESTISLPVTEPSPSKPSVSSNTVDEESFVEYSTNRRLTRHQSAIIEKSLHMARKMSAIPEVINDAIFHEDHESEAESAVSNISNTSKRSTRSKLSQQSRSKSQTGSNNRPKAVYSSRSSVSKRDSSDAESYDTDQSASPSKKSILETISEEGDKTILKSRRRGRPRKN
ncbi:protein ELYS isoform X2 [Wyeomyia smithii]|nr:protein ELYS isoform X2 [Wyeomyia smithii]